MITEYLMARNQKARKKERFRERKIEIEGCVCMFVFECERKMGIPSLDGQDGERYVPRSCGWEKRGRWDSHVWSSKISHFFLFFFFPKGWGVTLYINVLLFIVYTHFCFF